MIARSAALCAAITLAIGCSNYRSQYARQSAVPGELVWRYDDERLQVTRSGQLVAEAGAWDGLAPAVACVPRAHEWASRATTHYHTGTVMMWGGLIGAFVSLVAGIALIARSDYDDRGPGLAAFGLVVVGPLGGLTIGTIGSYMRATAEVRGIDAINLYNDHIVSGGLCTK